MTAVAEKKEHLPEWDLSDLYPGKNSPELEKDLQQCREMAERFASNYAGKVDSLDGDALGKAVQEYEALSDLMGRLHSYADLTYASNMADGENGRFYQRIQEALNDISSTVLFFTLALNRLDDAELAKKMKGTALEHYRPWLEALRVMRPYQLEDRLEQLLLEKAVAGSNAWIRLFDETIADLRFSYEGKALTCEEIFDLMTHKDEKVRREAGREISRVLSENIKLFTMVTNNLAKDKAIEDKWRGFKRPIASRNVANLVEDEVVDALIAAVKQAYPDLAHRYFKLKAKWLGKEKLGYWDRNAPLPDGEEKRYGWEEARNLVLDSYGGFAPRLRELGQKFFDRPWIDVPVRPGKAQGAFAHPTVPSAHPYLLLNYQGKPRDVMTLAHELGHGVHQLLSAKQGALMADTPLTLAETASVFGEQLTFREMLKRETNEARRKRLIAQKVEDMLNTVVRQIAFCEFERQVHDARREGELSPEQLGEIWMQAQSESLGPAFDFDQEYQYFWSYIPHFIHSPFYVYAYAFGDCLVNALYACYLDGMEGFEDKYFTMLEAGGTLHHKELLAPFGLDASRPDFWNKGLGIISDFIDQLE